MAKPRTKGTSKNSTTKHKSKSNRSPQVKIANSPVDARLCDCPRLMALLDVLDSMPSGSLVYVEDGTFVAIPPISGAAYLRVDPNVGGGVPYWEPE